MTLHRTVNIENILVYSNSANTLNIAKIPGLACIRFEPGNEHILGYSNIERIPIPLENGSDLARPWLRFDVRFLTKQLRGVTQATCVSKIIFQ
jgi:hypothetical protein